MTCEQTGSENKFAKDNSIAAENMQAGSSKQENTTDTKVPCTIEVPHKEQAGCIENYGSSAAIENHKKGVPVVGKPRVKYVLKRDDEDENSPLTGRFKREVDNKLSKDGKSPRKVNAAMDLNVKCENTRGPLKINYCKEDSIYTETPFINTSYPSIESSDEVVCQKEAVSNTALEGRKTDLPTLPENLTIIMIKNPRGRPRKPAVLSQDVTPSMNFTAAVCKTNIELDFESYMEDFVKENKKEFCGPLTSTNNG